MPNHIRGLVRTLVQTIVSAILAHTLVQDVLGVVGVDLNAEQVTLFLVPLVMGVYWSIGAWLQRQNFVRSTPVLEVLVGIAMGGRSAPSYTGYVVVTDDGRSLTPDEYVAETFNTSQLKVG